MEKLCCFFDNHQPSNWYHKVYSQQASTADTRDISRYSLYMLWVPDLESYRSQIPKFLICWGRFSWIWKHSRDSTSVIASFPTHRHFRTMTCCDDTDMLTWLTETISPEVFLTLRTFF